MDGRYAQALPDFERSIALRPAIVRDTGQFRFILGCVVSASASVLQATSSNYLSSERKPATLHKLRCAIYLLNLSRKLTT